VVWHRPTHLWLKCNTDGASKGNPRISGCGGIFRNASADALLCFAEPLGIKSSYTAELCGLMRNIWFETDSSLVLLASKNPDNVPWELRNRWKNAMLLTRLRNFMVTHIFREGNQVADSLANHALTIPSYTFWHEPPVCIKDSFLKNKLGIPSFRFC
jgi:ribonuclease HI